MLEKGSFWRPNGWICDLLNEPSAILGGKRSPVTKVWEKVIEEGEIELHPNL
jgi:hypothetical protein